jgi:hypothetical protein
MSYQCYELYLPLDTRHSAGNPGRRLRHIQHNLEEWFGPLVSHVLILSWPVYVKPSTFPVQGMNSPKLEHSQRRLDCPQREQSHVLLSSTVYVSLCGATLVLHRLLLP